MNKAIISFVVSIVIGFGLGYLVFGVIMGDSDKEPQVAQTEQIDEASETEGNKEEAKEETATVDANNILNSKGCLGCHAVDSLGLEGGATGPDLSKAFTDVEGKHGKSIDEFLKEPTSAVMSSVIGGSPLTDEERTQVLDMLKQASEK
ncbi:cytochrome C [Bacillus sp. 7884-1]|jgi:cytochrome c551/c552|uniref:cytochrome C n=1 Tax=Bacillus sp. 7884-1 TaxID=2021693 RepID=UPI000BA52573|nr:cytochrome C [Bacillus sp. 7884-1]PAE43603.1 cytochrome C [Bacillus sp. 7884-1]